MVPPVNIQTSSQVEAAEAALKAARDTESQTRHNLEQLRNNRAAAAADLVQAERDFKRFESPFGFRRRDPAPERAGANRI